MAAHITKGFLTGTIIHNIPILSSYPCNSKNYTNMDSRDISYIVMHYTGNIKDTAINNAKYYNTANGAQASAHFFVDDTSIYQSVELRDKAWHCGTTKTYYHNKCRNSNSIGIEMCCTAGNYTPSDITILNSAYLCAYLCKLIGITANQVDEYVIRHYDVTHKECPRIMVRDINKWIAFKQQVKNILNAQTASTIKKEEQDMSYEEFKTFMNKYLTELAESPCTWEETAMDWAEQKGLIKGDYSGHRMAKKFVTRGELATILARYSGINL